MDTQEASTKPTYIHGFKLSFAVTGSSCPKGSDVTAEQISEALLKRIYHLLAHNEILEAVGTPFDSIKE